MDKIFKDDWMKRFVWVNKHITVPPEFVNDTPCVCEKILKEDLHG